MRQCMGGNCRVREKCAHYYAEPNPRLPPAERLCEVGEEVPIKQHTVKSWTMTKITAPTSVWDLAK